MNLSGGMSLGARRGLIIDDDWMVNPLTELPVYAGFWADDPAWSNGGVGTAPASLLLGGSLAASGAYLDPSAGLVLPGVAGNYASTPDAAALDITGDITLVARVAPEAWDNGSTQAVIAKWQATGDQRSYYMPVMPGGVLRIQWTTLGTLASSRAVNSTSAVPFADGEAGWIAATLDVDNGAGGNDVTFWTSVDGVTWTQLGTTVTSATATSIFAGTANVEFSSINYGNGQYVTGATSVARIYSGSGFSAAGPSGTLVLDVDFRRARTNQFTCSTGQTVTVTSTFDPTQSDASARGTLTTSALLGGRRVLDLDGVNDCYPLTTGVSLAQPFEVWWIGTLDAIASRSIVGLLSTNAVSGVTASAGAAFSIGSGGTNITAGSASSVNTPYALRSVFNTTASSLYQNGASIATGTIAAFTADQFVIGAGRVAPSTYSRFQDGKTAMLLALPTASITQAHRTAAGLWAASFYGVPGFVGAFG